MEFSRRTLILLALVVLIGTPVIGTLAYLDQRSKDNKASHNANILDQAKDWYQVYTIKTPPAGMTLSEKETLIDSGKQTIALVLVGDKDKRVVITQQKAPNTDPEFDPDRVLDTSIGEAKIRDKLGEPVAIIMGRSTLVIFNFPDGYFAESEVNRILQSLEAI